MDQPRRRNDQKAHAGLHTFTHIVVTQVPESKVGQESKVDPGLFRGGRSRGSPTDRKSYLGGTSRFVQGLFRRANSRRFHGGNMVDKREGVGKGKRRGAAIKRQRKSCAFFVSARVFTTLMLE